jgi:hypothetical protein
MMLKQPWTLLLAMISLSGACLAQCSNGGSGTTCTGPVTVSPPTGNTTQSAIILTDLGSGTNAPAPSVGNYVLSIVGGIIQESDNNGFYHSLIGSMGPIGLQGPSGPTGSSGATGPQGLVGNQGVQGLTGPLGATGSQGAQGAIGPLGLTGSQGVQGVIGPLGATGDVGATGAVGVTGPTGQGVPAGGSAGARLLKSSSADFATGWANTFLNVQGPAAPVTTSPGADVTVSQYLLPANTMTSSSVLRIYLSYKHTSGISKLTYKMKIGTAVIPLISGSSGTTVAYQEILIANLGSTNSQAFMRGPGYGVGGLPMPGLTGALNVDTTVDQVIQLTANAASSTTDQVTPGFFAVELQ